MRIEPGFVKQLREDLGKLPFWMDERLAPSNEDLIKVICAPTQNVVSEPCTDKITQHSNVSIEVEQIGTDAIVSGQVGYVVLAGGRGTRLGLGTKALVKLASTGMSLLAIKLMQSARAPVFVMTDPATSLDVADLVGSISGGPLVKTFNQFQTLKLTPDNRAMIGPNWQPVLLPSGNGDAIPALAKPGCLDEFKKNGGKYLFIVDVDNVLASLDPTTVGFHIASGKKVTCEAFTNESLGFVEEGLCWVNGRLQARQFDPELRYTYGSTGTFVVDADIDVSNVKWRWHRMRKFEDGMLYVQHERFMSQLTEEFETAFLAVEKSKRFLAVKDNIDLVLADEQLKWK